MTTLKIHTLRLTARALQWLGNRLLTRARRLQVEAQQLALREAPLCPLQPLPKALEGWTPNGI